MTTTRERIRVDDLTPHLLLKNGNFLYKLPFRDGFAVLKVYYGSRGFFGRVLKSISNVVFQGQTSYMPRTRLKVERDCMRTWQKHGFRVFEVFDDVEVEAPGLRQDGYLLMEFMVRPKLNNYLADSSIPEDERFTTYRRWLQEWSRRHDVAIAERDPRLVHENGDGKHVYILEDGGFLWFDFEMIFRSPNRVADYVSHEIIQYVWNIHKNIPEEIRERLLDETVAGYPDRERLLRSYDYFFRNPRFFQRMGRAFDRRFYKRARKPTSKYNIARRLRERLERG